MKLNIKRQKGRFVAYVSRSIPQPNKDFHDYSFRGDEFEITEPGMKFKNENFHTAFFAIEDTIINLNVTFGRDHKKKLTEEGLKNLLKSSTIQVIPLRAEIVAAIARKKKRKGHSKDFISINKIVQRSHSQREA